MVKRNVLPPHAFNILPAGTANGNGAAGGDFLSLWHNSNLAATPDENPWTGIYRQAVRYAVSLEEHGHAVSFVI
ncbi:MAG: hypothetical protein LBH61_02550 [Dysgonamonadaceae bacterium]|jgi:hypothetical protein|nr:hypothetical protein [Dysgonamonadaceae bacterium]